MASIFRRKPKRRALRQFESAADLRAQWRALIGAEPVPAYAYPATPPAYAEELRGFAPPDWSFIHEYPYEAGEFAATQWGGEVTLRPCQIAS